MKKNLFRSPQFYRQQTCLMIQYNNVIIKKHLSLHSKMFDTFKNYTNIVIRLIEFFDLLIL